MAQGFDRPVQEVDIAVVAPINIGYSPWASGYGVRLWLRHDGSWKVSERVRIDTSAMSENPNSILWAVERSMNTPGSRGGQGYAMGDLGYPNNDNRWSAVQCVNYAWEWSGNPEIQTEVNGPRPVGQQSASIKVKTVDKDQCVLVITGPANHLQQYSSGG